MRSMACERGVGERHACLLLGRPPSTQRYRPTQHSTSLSRTRRKLSRTVRVGGQDMNGPGVLVHEIEWITHTEEVRPRLWNRQPSFAACLQPGGSTVQAAGNLGQMGSREKLCTSGTIPGRRGLSESRSKEEVWSSEKCLEDSSGS